MSHKHFWNLGICECGHIDPQVLVRIEHKLDILISKEKDMAKELDDLIAQVAKNTDAENAAGQALDGLKAKLDAAIAANSNGDPSKLAALSAALGSSSDALSAAIVRDTAADPNAQPPAPSPAP